MGCQLRQYMKLRPEFLNSQFHINGRDLPVTTNDKNFIVFPNT
ncbi:Uncharacterized protein dnm_014630 [Desulfonema magnum]|uniref:Uncharacterized protein n=1 Tax=Desulfonema magnum TaxID=45655 RepID=A0A975GM44_9BACT|nr:Uncharacterized protein dnm_014630 [Desulfonema magnum]